MPCSQCEGIENLFDKNLAQGELKDYHSKGPAKATRLLLDFIRASGVQNRTLLDIGGGVGVIQHELFKAGIQSAVDVDASTAYLNTAREEAGRQGYQDRVQYLRGDFVELAPQVQEADIVTLDRVICCYPDMKTLVRLSSERAGKLYALVYPRDSWWMRIGRLALNAGMWIQRRSFRFFVHSSADVDAILRENGLQQRYQKNAGLIWQVVIYSRA